MEERGVRDAEVSGSSPLSPTNPFSMLKASAILVGTTIGAGIFAIPYAVAQIGLIPGIFYLLGLGAVVLLLNLIYGEVILRTAGDHQLTGYSQIYLGKGGQRLASLALFIGLYGALLAYLIKIGEFLALIFNFPFPLELSLVFFFFAVTVIFLGLKIVSQLELVLVSILLIFILFIACLGFPHIALSNFQFSVLNFKFLFLPYGVILFALTGSAAVPEMEEVLRSDNRDKAKKLKKALILGSLIPLLAYLLFAIIIVGISGRQTSDDAISGLALFLPKWIVNLGAGLGILTMATSFLSLGYVLSEVWFRDFKLPRPAALILACSPPLVFFLTGARNFISVLEISGALTGSLSGILIILLHRKAQKIGRKQPAYHLKLPIAIYWLLIIIFCLGIFSPLLT